MILGYFNQVQSRSVQYDLYQINNGGVTLANSPAELNSIREQLNQGRVSPDGLTVVFKENGGERKESISVSSFNRGGKLYVPARVSLSPSIDCIYDIPDDSSRLAGLPV